MPPADTPAAEGKKLGQLVELATEDQLVAEIAKRRGCSPVEAEHQLDLEPLGLDELVEGLAGKTQALVVLAVLQPPVVQVASEPPPPRFRAWCKKVGPRDAAEMATSFVVSCRQELERARLRLQPKG